MRIPAVFLRACRMTRREKARIVADRVAARIREVVPAGLGHWGPVWEFIGTPSDAFMDRLAEWEAEDTPAIRSQLEAASADLIEAWAEAARQWKESGRPSLEETNVKKVETGVTELVS